ncbi:hypothetical protein MX01_221 [Escherichia phage MX01]|uniref:Uncharacterized protein n=1 Tax=Escherichia phage MX01 TaxID=1837930 RepID=A0A172Q2B8_9CAUD|nr:hypothetical protein BOW90_gp221 [Escherichia phage MX01]AND76166.1 hypothetical protein MX01_221 [Escherichia phage MX01]
MIESCIDGSDVILFGFTCFCFGIVLSMCINGIFGK